MNQWPGNPNGQQPPAPYGPPPQGYGPPPQGYGPPGYYPTPPQAPPKKGMHPLLMVLAIVGGIFVFGFGGCVLCMAAGMSQSKTQYRTTSAAAPESPAGTTQAVQSPSRIVATSIETLLSDYKNNELDADNKYKGEVIQVTGLLKSIKKDITNDPYVTLGTTEGLEIPVVQCSLKASAAGVAAKLSKGSMVTVRGKVSGLMMNVQVRECEIIR